MKTGIVIHHSATPDGDTFNWTAIRRFHTSWRFDGRVIDPGEAQALTVMGKRVEAPWSDVGYHWGIEMVAGFMEVIQGRPMDSDGAHCRELNMNRVGIGICCVGNFDLVPPGPGIVSKLTELCLWLMKTYSIPVDKVLGHREAQEKDGKPLELRKSCPGKLFDMDAFRGILTQKLTE